MLEYEARRSLLFAIAVWYTGSVPDGIYFIRLSTGDCPRMGTVPKTGTAKAIVSH
jgi:hypothetical protein